MSSKRKKKKKRANNNKDVWVQMEIKISGLVARERIVCLPPCAKANSGVCCRSHSSEPLDATNYYFVSPASSYKCCLVILPLVIFSLDGASFFQGRPKVDRRITRTVV
ncbi:hypothetical protein CEXT_24211 [Caerostris extrusa]|uniref:Uncharacterized protein n=1 Tax=Caerostris extrusa TaxID=172846 RepID=A0AAV4SJL1_CAEEX|nr:hypothetical protein CEXT_24211 [Caerostris extrusa]